MKATPFKILLLGTIIMISTKLCASEPTNHLQDIAAIETIVESVGNLADRGNFEALEQLYAPEVLVDYSSLNGQQASVKSPQTLMSEWAGVLPGFDSTRHSISHIETTLNGEKATARAKVSADHYVKDLYWQVSGHYVYEFSKDGDDWLITSHTFNVESEQGTRGVFELAIKNVVERPSSYLLRKKTRQVVSDFLQSLEQKDMDRFAQVWADDAVQDMPFSPEGFPKRVTGKEQVLSLYSAWPETAGEHIDFTSELIFYPMVDPQMIFAEWKGEVDIVPTGRRYQQTYAGVFHIEENKIKLFREYFNPQPFAYAFAIGE